MLMRFPIILALLISLSWLAPAQTPAPYDAIPSARQLAWHKMKFYAFVHVNMNTFTNEEWGHSTVKPDDFDPTQLECRQWA